MVVGRFVGRRPPDIIHGPWTLLFTPVRSIMHVGSQCILTRPHRAHRRNTAGNKRDDLGALLIARAPTYLRTFAPTEGRTAPAAALAASSSSSSSTTMPARACSAAADLHDHNKSSSHHHHRRTASQYRQPGSTPNRHHETQRGAATCSSSCRLLGHWRPCLMPTQSQSLGMHASKGKAHRDKHGQGKNGARAP